VQILEAGEILLARQCHSEAEARYAAEACRQDPRAHRMVSDRERRSRWKANLERRRAAEGLFRDDVSMTVISTVFTRHFTALASDSRITEIRNDGSLRIIEDKEPKITRVPAFWGATAYWGLARIGRWNTKRWLDGQARAADSKKTAHDHALAMASAFTEQFRRAPIDRLLPPHGGLGIHFTAYERIDNSWIPELFVITNFTDETYGDVRSTFEVTRETYRRSPGLPDRPFEEHGEPSNRKAVHEAFHKRGLLLMFNNGNPRLFNPVANSMLETFRALVAAGNLRDATSVETHLALARRPVKVLTDLLADLANRNTRVIGGKPHDLAINPNGPRGGYVSSTGD
jgi:hypothetical protein